MSNKFENTKKDAHLSSFPTVSIEAPDDELTQRCKFNFHYMDFSQLAGQKFEDWTNEQLIKMLNKLNNYCTQPLKYWLTQAQRVGKRSHNVLEVYGDFPLKSEFKHPKHVPCEVKWARFRMENLVRIIGFVIPDEFNQRKHEGTNKMFDCNTFYVVFLDKNHKFYS
jgi:hypothetical protein